METKKIKNEEDKVWVNLTTTINLGDYENIKIESGYSKTIKTGDKPMELIRKMEEELESFLSECRQEIKPTTERRRKRR